MTEAKKEYPRPSLTADVVVVALGAEMGLRVLFVRRAHDPYAGRWAFPGGFVEPTETVGQAAVRELREETSLDRVDVEEIGCFSKPGRDPRGWVVTVAHLALVPADRLHEVKVGDDAAAAEWLDLSTAAGEVVALTRKGHPVGPLAFDHDEILARAVEHLVEHPTRHALSLLPPVFTLDALEAAAFAIHGEARHGGAAGRDGGHPHTPGGSTPRAPAEPWSVGERLGSLPIRETAPGSGQYTRSTMGA
jgi:8-oxo-dGTP diphosphatase